MRKLPVHFLILLISCCSCFSANAQSASTIKTPSEKGRYFIISVGGSVLASNNKGTMNISIPYTVTDTGGTKPGVLSKDIVPFPKSTFGYIAPIDLEIGNRQHFFSAQFSIATQKIGAGESVAIGYGRNFYFDLSNKHAADPLKSAFVFKPSISIAFSQFGSAGDETTSHATSLGSIDNTNRSIRLLGNVADSLFTIQQDDNIDDSDNVDSYDVTYHAQTLYVNYIHREWMITPRIAISNNQYTHWLHWELSLGYQLSVSQDDGIGLEQSGISSTHDNRLSGFIDLYKTNSSITYNKNIVTRSPFDLSGLFIGFKIGVVV